MPRDATIQPMLPVWDLEVAKKALFSGTGGKEGP